MKLGKLFNLIKREEVCLFIGAGFSNYAGYPTGKDLSTIFFESFSEEEKTYVDKSAPLSKISQDFEMYKSRDELNNILKSEFQKHPITTFKHDKLASIPFFRTIITTNYDKLIENSYDKNGVRVLIKAEDVANCQGNVVKVYKMHGCVEFLDKVIITEQDYSKLYNVDYTNPFWSSLVNELVSKHVIFLGYGYADLNVWALFEKILGYVGKNNTKQKIFISDRLNPNKEKILNYHGVVSIKMSDDDFLVKLEKYIKLNLTKDVANNVVSLDTARKIFSSYDLKVNVDVSKQNKINSIEKTNGLTRQEIGLTISDSDALNRFFEFQKGNGGISLSLNKNDLSRYNHNIEGFRYMDRNDISNIIVKRVPQFSQKCTLKIVKSNLELENIKYDVYYLGNNKMKIQALIDGFELNLDVDTQSLPNLNFKFSVSEPKIVSSLNKAILFYDITHRMFRGEAFSIYFENGSKLLNKTFDMSKMSSLDYIEYMNFYCALKRIEEYFDIKFNKIETRKFDKYLPSINCLIQLMDDNRAFVKDEAGVLFENKDFKSGGFEELKEMVESNEKVLCWTDKKANVTFKIFDADIDLGDAQYFILDPYISDFNKNNVLIKSRAGQIMIRYEKFGVEVLEEDKRIN